METYEALKMYFSEYMTIIRGRSESTAKHYLDALNNISRHLKEAGIVQNSIYEITDLEELLEAREYLLSSTKFIEQDKRGNQMYSAGLNNYLKFAEGEAFESANDSLDSASLDTVIPVQEKRETSQSSWKRSNIIRSQSIQMAKYRCEMDKSHETFIVANTNHSYMEGHHAIPMRKQIVFPHSSLDVYANIVCMCPLCHRKVHYAGSDTKKEMLNQIYDQRGERLAKSGIRLSRSEFVQLILE